MKWVVPITALDSRQTEAVQLSAARHRAVVGGPLTGKTQVLLHRARYLRQTYDLAPKQLAIWTSNEATKSLLQSVAPLFGIPPECIECYDAWCEQIFSRVVGDRLPNNPITGERDKALIRIVARHAVQWGFALAPSYAALLIDDGDGLDPADLRVICGRSKHLTIFLCAESSEDQKGLEEFFTSVGLRCPDVRLELTYQKNRKIPAFVENLRREADDQCPNFFEGEVPGVFAAEDDATEVARVADVIRERMMNNEHVGVLVPSKDIAAHLCTRLRERHFTPEVHDVDGFPMPDVSTSHPKIYTFKDGEGVNFETVIVPFLNRSAFRGYSQHDLLEIVALCASSATKWLYISCSKPVALTRLAGTSNASERPSSQSAAKDRKIPFQMRPIDDLLF